MEEGLSKKSSGQTENMYKAHPAHNKNTLTLVVVIICVGYALFFVLQVKAELDVRLMVLKESQWQQERTVAELARNIGEVSDGEDLDSRMEEIGPNSRQLADDDSLGSLAVIDGTGSYLWASESSGEGSLGSPSDLLSEMSLSSGKSVDGKVTDGGRWPSTSIQSIDGVEYLTTISEIPAENSNTGGSVSDIISTPDPLYLIAATPVSVFWDEIEGILYGQRMQNFSLVAGVSFVTIIMTFFMNRNVRLKQEARNHALELEQSNKMIMSQQMALEQANRTLVNMDRIKDNFISIASHELKNPIQPILLCSELAKRGEMDKDKALDIILFNGRRLRQLASDILDVSKIDTGSFSYVMGRVRINDLMSELVKSSALVGNPNIKLEISIDKDIELEGDKIRLNQVFFNLISNSAKFTSEGVIRIQTKTLVSEIEISISDTGSGIPEDVLPNLFGKFVSFSADQRNRHGSGLGLYIAKAIVNAHNGEIIAKNNAPSKGATFTVSLPLTQGINNNSNLGGKVETQVSDKH